MNLFRYNVSPSPLIGGLVKLFYKSIGSNEGNGTYKQTITSIEVRLGFAPMHVITVAITIKVSTYLIE